MKVVQEMLCMWYRKSLGFKYAISMSHTSSEQGTAGDAFKLPAC